MRLNEINIRDPFILPHEGVYYLFGTRAATCWGEADGFDGYRSVDLSEWDGPFEVFHRPADFWADKNYWAPEVHFHNGHFYMFATFNSVALDKKGTMILIADAPLGPYRLHSEGKITPEEWNCLDGTFYLSRDRTPYMVFSHEWTDTGDGEICSIPLTADLRRPAGEPRCLFRASMGKPWVRGIKHRSRPDPVYVTDGPFLFRGDAGELLMLWSSFGESGYAEALARSDNGDITGNWSINPQPLFADDGGHGMIFDSFDGHRYLILHKPNETPLERPVLKELPLHHDLRFAAAAPRLGDDDLPVDAVLELGDV